MLKENVKYGWIGLYRSMTSHWIYPTGVFTKYEAWIDLLLMVNYEEKKVFDGADMQSCEKGETITSQIKLMKKWGWSKSKLLKFLKVLKSDLMIDYKADTKKTTIKVLNFHSYQDFEAADKLKKDHRKTVERLEKDYKKTIEELTKRLQKDTNNKDNTINKETTSIKEPKKEDVLYNIEDLKIKYQKNERLLKAFSSGQKTTIGIILLKLDEFNIHLASEDKNMRKWDDYTSHFRNWFKKNKEIIKNSGVDASGKNATDKIPIG